MTVKELKSRCVRSYVGEVNVEEAKVSEIVGEKNNEDGVTDGARLFLCPYLS